MRAEAERLPLRAVCAEWVHGTPAIAGLLVVLFIATKSAHPAAEWSMPVILALIAARLAIPLFLVMTTRIVLGEDGLSVRTGVIRIRTATVQWLAVRVIHVEEPFAYRLFRLGKVSILPAGDGDSTLRIDGAPASWIAEIRHRQEAATVSARGPESRITDGAQQYRAGTADLLMTCLAQGRIVVMVGALTFAGYDMLGDIGLLPFVAEQLERNPLLSGSVLGVALVSGAAIVTVVRYYGLTLEVDGGVLRISHGIVDRMRRTVTANALVGVRVRRNLLEMLTDRVRISLLTSDGVRGLGQNLILPSIPRSRAREAITMVEPELAGLKALSTPGTRVIARSFGQLLVVLTGSCGGGWIALSASSPPWVSILAVVASATLLLSAFRLASMTLELRDGDIAASRCSIVDIEERLRASELHGLSMLRIRSSGRGLIRAHFFAGRSRHWVALTSRADVEALEAIASARDRGRVQTRGRLT